MLEPKRVYVYCVMRIGARLFGHRSIRRRRTSERGGAVLTMPVRIPLSTIPPLPLAQRVAGHSNQPTHTHAGAHERSSDWLFIYDVRRCHRYYDNNNVPI